METYNVHDLIPQQPPFVLIDELAACTETVTLGRLTVREDNPFYTGGRLQASGLVETIAQTCAARIGYQNRRHQEEIKIGVIGAIRDLTIGRLPLKGETLTTRIEVTSEVMALTLVHASVQAGKGETIATCEMKIAVRE